MTVSYNTILREVAVTVNALTGALPPALQTSYATVPLTSANFQSSIFPFGFLKDKILNAQENLFMPLASTATNPLRPFIESQTDALTYGAQITVNAAGLPVVGAYGAVRDAESSRVLTLNEIEDIQLRVENPNSMFRVQVYQYAIVGDRVFPTTEEVIVDVCAYERPESDSLDLTASIMLPDILGPAMVQGAIAECYRDDEYLEQSGRATDFYGRWVQALQGGMARIEPQSNPTPDAQTAYARG